MEEMKKKIDSFYLKKEESQELIAFNDFYNNINNTLKVTEEILQGFG